VKGDVGVTIGGLRADGGRAVEPGRGMGGEERGCGGGEGERQQSAGGAGVGGVGREPMLHCPKPG
jgi:hypothetical protein